MRVSKLQSYWIIFRCLLATFSISVAALFLAYINRLDRTKVDNLTRNWSKKLLKLVRTSYEVFNPEQVVLEHGKHYIIMSNHCSHYDIPLIMLTFPGSIRMIAKKELFRVPIWGKAMKVSEFISIDRNNRRQAIQDLRRAKEKMESGIAIWIAPEGTRSRDGKLLPFKKGGFMLAIKTDAIIIPIGIRGSSKILPAKSVRFNLNEHVEIHIGKPIEVAHYAADQKKQLIQDVDNSIRAAAGQGII